MVSLRKRILILLAVFAAASLIGMIGAPDTSGEEIRGSSLTRASLPVLCAEFGEQLINPLYGSTSELIDGTDELSVYPIVEDELNIFIHLLDCGEKPGAVNYELRSEEDGRLLERGTVKTLSGSLSDLYFKLTLKDMMTEGRYYRLKFTLELSGQKADYYTRVIKLKAQTVNTMVEYAMEMHRNLYDQKDAQVYMAKLETSSTSDKNTLAHVNINSSFKQVSWNQSGARQVSDSWLTIRNINGNYGYFTVSCLVQAETSENVPSEFRVREDFTLQLTSGRIYVLRYDRTMDQLWELKESAISAKGLVLGVQNEDSVSFKKSEKGNILAFAVGNELYSYNVEQQLLTKIFSFRSENEHELRTLQQDCSIKLMEADDEGTIEFIVYGYMNGGLREGCCGISYFTYDPAKGNLIENMYLESDKPYELLKEEVETLFCKGNDHFLYFYFDRKVYVMDFSSGETAVLVNSQEIDSLVVNQKGTSFAWQTGADQVFPRSLRVVNLEEGTSLLYEATSGEFVRSLGFIQEDIIVGVGSLSEDPIFNGRMETHPLHTLEILDKDLNLILEYTHKNRFITGIREEAGKVTIYRYGKTAEGYTSLEPDVLLRKDGDPDPEESGLGTTTHEKLLRMLYIPCQKLPSYLRIDRKNLNAVIYCKALVLPTTELAETVPLYFAYGAGRFKGSFSKAGDAIASAAADYGFVTDESGRLLWYWKSKLSRSTASSVYTGQDILAEDLIELTGANFRSLMFFIDQGEPIYWINPSLGELLIVGYTTERITVRPLAGGEDFFIPMSEVDSRISAANNYIWTFKQ